MGVNALMVQPPFFISPGADAVQGYIAAIATEVNLPVIVQYAPIQTRSSMTVDRLVSLNSGHPNLLFAVLIFPLFVRYIGQICETIGLLGVIPLNIYQA
jgi:hypothetical protein